MPLTSLNPNLLGQDSTGASKLNTAGGTAQLHSTGLFAIANNSANNFAVANNGNVGVGTASPDNGVRLDIRDNSGFAAIQLAGTGIATGQLTSDGSTQLTLKNVSNGPLLFGSNNTTRAFIAANGNIGIGTSSPASLLDITGNDPTLRFTDNAGSPASTWSIRSNDGLLSFRDVTNGADRVVIGNTGNFGIGTTNPNALLTATQNIAADAFVDVYQAYSASPYAAYLRLNTANQIGSRYSGIVSATGGVTQWQITGGGSDSTIVFGTGSSATERMRINSSGDVGIGTNSPLGKTDIRGNFYINNSTTNQSDKRAFFQTITGVLTSASSGVAKSIAYVFHHHCIRIFISVSSSDNNCSGGTWIGSSNYVCGSGVVTQEATQTYYSGGGTNLSGISVAYQNSSGENPSFPNYIIRVTNNFSGTTPLIWYTIQGIASDTMVAIQN